LGHSCDRNVRNLGFDLYHDTSKRMHVHIHFTIKPVRVGIMGRRNAPSIEQDGYRYRFAHKAKTIRKRYLFFRAP
jgi:hypothetical protein